MAEPGKKTVKELLEERKNRIRSVNKAPAIDPIDPPIDISKPFVAPEGASPNEVRTARVNYNKAKIAARQKELEQSRANARELREKEVAERKEQIAQRSAEKEETRQMKVSEIKAKIDAIRKEKADKEKAEENQNKVFDDYNRSEREEREADMKQKQQDDTYDWEYVDGDKDSANIRRRTEVVEGEKEVVEKKEIIKDWEETGVSDKSIWENNKNGVKEKYDSYEEYQSAAQQYRDDQKSTEIKLIKKIVPTKEERVIEQNREDFEKTNHWSNKLPVGTVVGLTKKLNKNGVDMTPDQLKAILKTHSSEKDSVAWAKEQGYTYLLGGGRSASGSTTTRGKTNWN